jgi:hypothetical protein
MILLVVAATMVGGPALAQSTGQQNSEAGVPGAPGNKSGPAVTPPLKNPGEQSSGFRQDQSKVPGLPGSKSGPAQEPPKR